VKPKRSPAALALLAARNAALENEFAGQIAQRLLARLYPWRAMQEQAKPIPQYPFMPSRKWRYDYGWPDYGLLVDIDGGTYSRGAHARGGGIENDREKDANAVIRGWAVMRFTSKQVKSQKAVEWVEAYLRQRVPGA
jgi:hypothetical protein